MTEMIKVWAIDKYARSPSNALYMRFVDAHVDKDVGDGVVIYAGKIDPRAYGVQEGLDWFRDEADARKMIAAMECDDFLLSWLKQRMAALDRIIARIETMEKIDGLEK